MMDILLVGVIHALSVNIPFLNFMLTEVLDRLTPELYRLASIPKFQTYSAQYLSLAEMILPFLIKHMIMHETIKMSIILNQF